MTSRETILTAIKQNKPALLPLPEILVNSYVNELSMLEEFMEVLTRIGGTPVLINSLDEVAQDITLAFRTGDRIVNTLPGISDQNKTMLTASDAMMLEPVYKVYIEGTIGVAENGSIWLYESSMVNRLLPFICQHLVIVLKADKIVATMHDAYNQVNTAKEGYGLFIAGPSKTADIEQSLVIGAHGARSLKVFLIQ